MRTRRRSWQKFHLVIHSRGVKLGLGSLFAEQNAGRIITKTSNLAILSASVLSRGVCTCIIPSSTMTRDDAVDCATCLIEEILSCYYLLANLPSLNPSPTVNGLFEKLVHLCSQTLDEATSAKVSPRPPDE